MDARRLRGVYGRATVERGLGGGLWWRERFWKTVGCPGRKNDCFIYNSANMVRIYVNEMKKPRKQISGFHLRNYGWSSKKTIAQRRIALMMALYDTEEPKNMKNRMLHISQWNKKMCYDTYMFWDDLSYGDMWYLEHACDLASALKKC